MVNITFQELVQLLDYAHFYAGELCEENSQGYKRARQLIEELCRRNTLNPAYIGAEDITYFVGEKSYKCIKTGPPPSLKNL